MWIHKPFELYSKPWNCIDVLDFVEVNEEVA